MKTATVVLVTLLTLSAMDGASAQEWDWETTAYLWAAGIEGDVALGPISRDVNVDFSDLVDVLAGAALIRAEGGNRDHGVFGDLVWMQLEPEDEIATVGGTAEAQFDTLTLDLGYVRKLERVGLEVGIRYWDLQLELNPAQIAAIERDDSWVDGYVGVRVGLPLGGNWTSQARFNVGAGGSDSTFGLDIEFTRELQSGNSFVLGLKAVDIDYLEESLNGVPFEVDTTFLGGTLGFKFD